MLVLDLTTGVCAVIVWTYYIFGLSVVVNLVTINERQAVLFGKELPQVIINVHVDLHERHPLSDLDFVPNLMVFHKKTNEPLTLSTEPDDNPIYSAAKRLANGYASKILTDRFHAMTSSSGELPAEIVYCATAFARIISLKLRVQPKEVADEATIMMRNVNLKDQSYTVEVPAILRAARLLFGTQCVDHISIRPFVDAFQCKCLSEPVLFYTTMGKYFPSLSFLEGPEPSNAAVDFQYAIIEMGLLVLAFSQIIELDDCASLPLLESESDICHTDFGTIFSGWQGTEDILIEPTTLFTFIVDYMTNDKPLEAGRTHDHKSELVLKSSSGWSVYLNTLVDDLQPSQIGTYLVRLHHRSHAFAYYCVRLIHRRERHVPCETRSSMLGGQTKDRDS